MLVTMLVSQSWIGPYVLTARALSLVQRRTASERASLVKAADVVTMEVSRSGQEKEFDKKYSVCDFTVL
jgi:hypothetical protein